MLENIVREISSYVNIYNVSFILVMSFILYLAWLSTGIEPLNYRLWVAQLFSSNSHQVIQLHDLNKHNRRHVFWQAPFVSNQTPRVTTIVLVQRPTEVNLPSTRNVRFDYFNEGEGDNPDAEQQQQIADFISQNIDASPTRPEDENLQRTTNEIHPDCIDEHSNRWRRVTEVVQSEETVVIKLKHSDGSIKTVTTNLSSTVEEFKNMVFGVEAGRNTTLIFEGITLENAQWTLSRYGLYNECTVDYFTENEGEAVELITVRLKHLNDQIITANVRPTITVGDFKKSYFAKETDEGKVIRLIFQGQLLRNDSRTLSSYGILDQSVVHVHIGMRPYRQEGNTASPQPASDPADIFANPHLVVTGIAWLDGLLLTILSSILMLVRWAEADDVLDEDNSIFARIARWLRTVIRNLTTILAAMFANPVNDPELQHQFGNFFNFFIITKVFLIITACVLFPSFVDTKSMVLITIISIFAISFLWSTTTHRNPHPVPQQRPVPQAAQ